MKSSIIIIIIVTDLLRRNWCNGCRPSPNKPCNEIRMPASQTNFNQCVQICSLMSELSIDNVYRCRVWTTCEQL